MLHKKKVEKQPDIFNAVAAISKPAEEEKQKIPKSVKPLSKKHFQPLMDELTEIRKNQELIKSNQDDIFKRLGDILRPEIKNEETPKPAEETKTE